MNLSFVHTLRFKLTAIYVLTMVTPFIILAAILPYYFQGIITRDSQKMTLSTLNSIAINIGTYLDDLDRLTASPYLNENVIRALKVMADNRYETADEYTKLQTTRDLTGTLPRYLINTREDIISTIIIPLHAQAYLTTKSDTISLVHPFDFESQNWYRTAFAADGKAAFIGAHPQDYLTNSTTHQVFSVARLIKDPETGQPLAVILADADTVVLKKITQDISFNVSSSIAIFDGDQHLLFMNKPLDEDIIRQLSRQDGQSTMNVGDYLAITKQIPSANWKIVVLLSNSEFKTKVRWLYIIASLLALGGLLVTLLFFRYFSRGVVHPLKGMTKVMQDVKRGLMDTRFHAKGRDEISQLGASLNSMVYQLNELINREYKAVLAQRESEYRALQSQIQPHFLYNTLNGLIGLNRIGEKQQLEGAILSLSGMLRYILEKNQMTTIEEEFRFLHKYCMLQQIRFQERLTVHIYHDEATAPFRIPKLLLQPLVENAIIHGVEPEDRPCLVSIVCAAKPAAGSAGSVIRIEVRDDGSGFDPQTASASPRVGLANVKARLHMEYPDAIFTIDSYPHQGTAVVIEIPASADGIGQADEVGDGLEALKLSS